MNDLDKIINILKYRGPQTYEDLILQGFQGKESELDQLVFKGILYKKDHFFIIGKQ